jgi:diguanylate cyclase (GGDEF)-like protein
MLAVGFTEKAAGLLKRRNPMLSKIARSINIAVQVAVLGFEKSYRADETIDSILGYIDCLTNLPNRAAFERDRGAIDAGYSLIMIDVDDLKYINDTHGHLFGDKVLKCLASILSEAVLPSGKVYRLAGDEFLCVVPRKQVVAVCNIIRDNMRKVDGFTVSQGVVLWLVRGLTNDILRIADSAMYHSKKRGKGGITMAMPGLAQAN